MIQKLREKDGAGDINLEFIHVGLANGCRTAKDSLKGTWMGYAFRRLFAKNERNVEETT